MTGPTHREYSICFAFITAVVLYELKITNVNYYLVMIILLMTAKAGAFFPDLDLSWDNISNKTTINKIINTLIHMTGGKHRCWQTHSIDICTVFTLCSYFIPNMIYNNNIISIIDKEVIIILLLGFSSGWISHLYSDMLTSKGVRLFCFMKFKVKFVPKKIGNLVFSTGSQWEEFNFNLMKKVNILLGITSLIYPILIEYYV